MYSNEEKIIANKIRNRLKNRGIKVKMKFSNNTKSIYLIIDNGSCSSIRISDHKNYKNRSKYNVIKNYEGKRFEHYKGRTKMFYNFHMLATLISDIECERFNKILKYGYSKYKAIRDKKDLTNYNIYNKQVA